GGWLRAIATHVAVDHLRRARRDLPLAFEPEADVPDRDPVDAGTRTQIERAFAGLSPKLRVVATLALVEDVPQREIASALRISDLAVRVRLFRATRILRRCLQDLRPSHEHAR